LLKISKVICTCFFQTCLIFYCLLCLAGIYINIKLHNHEKLITQDTEK
jgi:hypothetical protein